MMILADECEGATYFDVYLTEDNLVDIFDRKMVSKCVTVNGVRFYIGVMNQNISAVPEEDIYEEEYDEEEI